MRVGKNADEMAGYYQQQSGQTRNDVNTGKGSKNEKVNEEIEQMEKIDA